MKDRTVATILALTKADDLPEGSPGKDEAIVLRGLLIDEVKDAVENVGMPKSTNGGLDDIPQEICTGLAREFRARAESYLYTAVSGIVPELHRALCQIAAIFEPDVEQELPYGEEEPTLTEEEQIAADEAEVEEEVEDEAEAI